MRQAHHNLVSNFALAWNSWIILVDKIVPIDSGKLFGETRKNNEKKVPKSSRSVSRARSLQSEHVVACGCTQQLQRQNQRKIHSKQWNSAFLPWSWIACAFLLLQNALHGDKSQFSSASKYTQRQTASIRFHFCELLYFLCAISSAQRLCHRRASWHWFLAIRLCHAQTHAHNLHLNMAFVKNLYLFFHSAVIVCRAIAIWICFSVQ